MVPPVGIEPTLLAEPDFESGASTSSTTGAREGFYIAGIGVRQQLMAGLRVPSTPLRLRTLGVRRLLRGAPVRSLLCFRLCP